MVANDYQQAATVVRVGEREQEGHLLRVRVARSASDTVMPSASEVDRCLSLGCDNVPFRCHKRLLDWVGRAASAGPPKLKLQTCYVTVCTLMIIDEIERG